MLTSYLSNMGPGCYNIPYRVEEMSDTKDRFPDMSSSSWSQKPLFAEKYEHCCGHVLSG
jgi:hypothetical protein